MSSARWQGVGFGIAAAILIAIVVVAPTAASLPQSGATVSLGSADIRIDGAAAGDLAGTSVSPAGDVNGDGGEDVIIGAPGADNNGRAESGSAYVVFSSITFNAGPTVDLGNLGQDGFRIDGAAAGDFAGISVSKAGDINQDGIDDVLVGAVDIAMTVPGAAYVVFGKKSTAPVDLAALGGGGLVMNGNTADRAGAAVAGGGDVNGDDIPDLAIAAPFTGKLGRNDNGSVYVLLSPHFTGTINLDALGAGGFRIDGPADNAFLGETGIATGDVTGDGQAEVIAGTRMTSNNGRATSGSAHVVFGKGSSTAVDTAALGAAGFRIDGASAGDQAGTAVGRVGDANGDGIGEVIVGSPRAGANGRTDSGSAHLVFGKSSASSMDLASLGAGGRRIDGAVAGDRLGTSAAGNADINRDGRGDAILGAPMAGGGAGSALALLGAPTTAALDSAALGTSGYTLTGIAGTDAVGSAESVGAVGDLDGDDRSEVLAAAPMADNNGRADSGSTYIFFGPSPKLGKCKNPLFGTSGNDRLIGTDDGDRIKGENGKDRVKGRKGPDCLIGGGGKDNLSGGGGKDNLKGGGGADKLKGGNGKDIFRGGGGNDRINSADGGKDKRIDCGGGKDKVTADKGEKVAKNCEKVKRR